MNTKSNNSAKIGEILLIFGKFCHASQSIIEEYILKNKVGQDALYVIGWEGTWGLLFTLILFASIKLL